MSDHVGVASELAAAEQALEDHDWQRAFDLLRQVGLRDLDARRLTMVAEAAWWLGRIDDAIDAGQRAYRLLINAGAVEEAALVAIRLAEDHIHKLEPSLGRGWLQTAVRLLGDQAPSLAQAQVRRFQAMFALESENDLDRALALAEESLQLAETFNDKDLRYLAIQDKGRILIAKGDTAAGLALMEEAMLPAISGELSASVTGRIYCNMVDTCERLGEYRRAFEWDDAARRWCEQFGNITGFPGICRVKRAEIRRYRGELEVAAAEAEHAADELAEYRYFVAQAYAELGEIRRRRGEWEAAEEAFARAMGLGALPLPGLALLRLDQGDTAAAGDMLEEALTGATLILDRARLLPAVVESRLRLGHVNGAREAAEELAEVSSRFSSPVWSAAANTAAGKVALAAGETEKAVDALRAALKAWSEAEMPVEAGLTRLALAESYQQAGKEDRARLERRAGEAVLERLGADGGLGRRRRSASKVAAMMFTDIVGSTQLLEAMGDQAWTRVLAWHDAMVRNCLLEHGGSELNHTGDGFFASFGDVDSAVTAAIEIQRRLEERRLESFAPEVRIGIHAAEVLEEAGSLRGKGVHIAARIGALAGPGEILVSGSMARLLGGSRRVGPARTVELKGLIEPVEVLSIPWN
ncbi:MAG TPA: adenylate/guanylate cyclase domain-containing protein [Acidimicrobiia bacterium]|nr:adenylate/guanylate cyclase domain-containing protein [Acidimicrobiia bacterium]